MSSLCSRLCSFVAGGCFTDVCKNNNCVCCSTQKQELSESRITGSVNTAASPIIKQPASSLGSPVTTSSVVSLQSERKITFEEMYLKAQKEFPSNALSAFADSLDSTYIDQEVIEYFTQQKWRDKNCVQTEYDDLLCDLFTPFLKLLKELRTALMLQKARRKMEELESSRVLRIQSDAAAGFCIPMKRHEFSGVSSAGFVMPMMEDESDLSLSDDFGNTINLVSARESILTYMEEITFCNKEQRETVFTSIQSYIEDGMNLRQIRELALQELLKDLKTSFKKPDTAKLEKICLVNKSDEVVAFDEKLLIADLNSVCANLDKSLAARIITRVELQLEDRMLTSRVLDLILAEIQRFPELQLEKIPDEIGEAISEIEANGSLSSLSQGLRDFGGDKLLCLYNKLAHTGKRKRLRDSAQAVQGFLKNGASNLFQFGTNALRKEDV